MLNTKPSLTIRTSTSRRPLALTIVLTVGSSLSLLPACDGGDDGSGDGGGGPRPEGAILIAERFNTPDGRAAYMGAYPALPTGSVDISSMVELGPEGDVFACAGAGFFYNPDAGTITKYDVRDDLSLVRSTSIDVLQEGISGWTGAHLCMSDEQAFIFNETGGRVVEYNPTTMVIVDAFDVPLPDIDQDAYYIQFFEPKIAGTLVYFPLTAINWDTLEVEPRSILATFDVSTKTLSFDYDERCQSTLGGMVDSAGNFYQLPEDGGFWSTYSPTPALPPDCILRVNAGQTTYDDAYVQYLPQGESLRAMWPIDDQYALASLITIADAPPEENLWDWYSLPIEPTRIDLKTGAAEPYPGLPDTQPMNSRKIVLDGESYYQVYSYDADGLVTKIDLTRLEADGPVTAFSVIGGDILALERLW